MRRRFLLPGIVPALVVPAFGILLVLLLREPTAEIEASASDYQLVSVTTLTTDGGRVDWSADGEWIAYDHREADGFWDVYRIRPDGTGNECLTCGRSALPNRHQGNPTWHPSGRYLLFQAEKPYHHYDWFHGNSDPGAGVWCDLWMLDLWEDKFYQLTDVSSGVAPPGGSLHPHFSHDGTKLLWGDLEGANTCYGNWRLAVASFLTDPEPQLSDITYYEPGDQKNWYESEDWALDDSGVYYACAPLAAQDDRSTDICHMDLDTQSSTRLTQTSGLEGEPAEWEEHGKLSPLGDAFVYMTSEGYGTISDTCDHASNLRTDLWIMNPDGSGRGKLTHYNEPGYPEYEPGGVIVSDMSWSPDATKLVAIVFYPATRDVHLKFFHFSRFAEPTPTPTPSPDTDGDGCTDSQELGPDPTLGGQRDPLNSYDFYDVPVPTLHSGGTLTNKDKAITIVGDVLAVLAYTGTSDGGPPNAAGIDYDEDIDGDTVKDGLACDRSVGVDLDGDTLGDLSGAPNGAITIVEDVMLVLAQSGHSCQAPP